MKKSNFGAFYIDVLLSKLSRKFQTSQKANWNTYLIIRNDFWRKKNFGQKNFFGLIFKVKCFFTMTGSWTNLDQNLKLLVLGASNIVLRLSEVSEIVSLTPNTIQKWYHDLGSKKSTQKRKSCAPPHIRTFWKPPLHLANSSTKSTTTASNIRRLCTAPGSPKPFLHLLHQSSEFHLRLQSSCFFRTDFHFKFIKLVEKVIFWNK